MLREAANRFISAAIAAGAGLDEAREAVEAAYQRLVREERKRA
jgi:Arc/MetJ family transcription regulator